MILVTPQLGENIGAAARAMLNCGLTDLRLVNPRDGWPNLAADRAAVGALELMPPVKVFETLGEAVKASAKILYGKGEVRTRALREGAAPLLKVGRRTMKKRR